MNAMMHNETNHNGNFAAPYRGPINAVHICLRKYIDFNGRASRSEFWWFMLFLVLGTIIVETLGLHFHNDAECRAASWLYKPNHCSAFFNCIICGLWHLAMLPPAYAVSVRRLHDIERSGWWVLLFVPSEMEWLIPAASDSIWGNVSTIVGLPLLVMMCLRGKPNDASIGIIEKLRRWFFSRLESRLDRAWLGGALTVAALTWGLLGMQYIALFLVGYFYLFVFFARKKIIASHPPGDASIIFCGFVHSRDLLPPKKFSERIAPSGYGMGFVLLVFLATRMLDAPGYLFNWSAQSIAAAFSAFVAGWFFLLRHKELFRAYAGDVKLATHDGFVKASCDYAKAAGPVISFIVIVSLWCAVLLLFTTDRFYPYANYDVDPSNGYAILARVGVVYLLFYFALLTLLPSKEKQ